MPLVNLLQSPRSIINNTKHFYLRKRLKVDKITYMTNAYIIKINTIVRIQSNTIFTSPTNFMTLFANGAINIQVDIPIEVDIPKQRN